MKSLKDLSEFEQQTLIQGVDGLLVQILGEPHVFVMVIVDEHGQKVVSNGAEPHIPLLSKALAYAALQLRSEEPETISETPRTKPS